MRLQSFILFSLLSAASLAQPAVTIHVNGAASEKPFQPAWNYFGYDEPNYTYAPNGRKLIDELAALSSTPVHIRTHNLLTTGDGKAALKWGSTNAYTEDASGKPVYDWTLVDKILNTYLQAGAKPFVEIGFMPKALSTHPDPYRHNFPNGTVFTGWSYPPNDYNKWAELVYQWAKHCADKYGQAVAESWNWEVWNEPDIAYWRGTPEEYDKLYDYSAAAVKRALPHALMGGPGSTGPANPKAAAFLQQFLEHCASGKNYVSGKQGSPLDFISFHVKGRPQLVAEHVVMGLAQQLKDTAAGFDIVRSFPRFQNLPIVLSEADPEGCAACSARTNPQNAYRNGTLYPAYEAVALKSMIDLARRSHANLAGILTWAFEFEDQPYFDGFRTLATNGIDKPVLNFFRMAGLVVGDRIGVDSSGSIPLETILHDGVRQSPDVDALATRSEHKIAVLVWNYQDEDVAGPATDVALQTSGLPPNVKRVLLRHYRIDQTHSNSYTIWKQLGLPQHPSPEQYRQLEQAGHLQLLEALRWVENVSGSANVQFSLPSEALSLLELSW